MRQTRREKVTMWMEMWNTFSPSEQVRLRDIGQIYSQARRVHLNEQRKQRFVEKLKASAAAGEKKA